MIAWMAYSAFVAMVIAAAARAAESLARLSGYRVRWVWVVALMLTVFLSAASLVRRDNATSPSMQLTHARLGDVRRSGTADASWTGVVKVRLENLRRLLGAPLLGTIARVRRTVPARVDVYALVFSSLLSVGLTLIVLGVAHRFRTARRTWPSATLQGIGVRVAPKVGPVVIGLVHPEIIVPQWLLGRRADDQRLVVTHEYEHIRAHDPLLLGLAWGAAIVAPWNPLIWYMMSRLRLAVELDCDARVLRRGAAPQSYGSLLIDVAQQSSALRLSALALADDSSHLHQRILAMKPSVPRFARSRAAIAASFALAGVLVACQATLPTDAEIERMDVAGATRAAQTLATAKHADTAVAYMVDGADATASEASAIGAEALARVEILTGDHHTPTRINLHTRKSELKALANITSDDSGRVRHLEARLRLNPDQGTGAVAEGSLVEVSKSAFTGLIFVDGVRATESQMKSLRAEQIESVDVIKGAAATALYGDPQAANGVITIKTKHKGSN